MRWVRDELCVLKVSLLVGLRQMGSGGRRLEGLFHKMSCLFHDFKYYKLSVN